jgi:hypothetical protein
VSSSLLAPALPWSYATPMPMAPAERPMSPVLHGTAFLLRDVCGQRQRPNGSQPSRTCCSAAVAAARVHAGNSSSSVPSSLSDVVPSSPGEGGGGVRHQAPIAVQCRQQQKSRLMGNACASYQNALKYCTHMLSLVGTQLLAGAAVLVCTAVGHELAVQRVVLSCVCVGHEHVLMNLNTRHLRSMLNG